MLLLVYNGPMQTTAKPAAVATGTGIKTLLQLVPSATLPCKIAEWGISFDGSAAATPGDVELIETDVAATVTAFAVADITKIDGDALNAGTLTTNLIQVGTALSGYTGSAEGTITAVRNLDAPQLIAPTTQFIKQFPLGDEPVIQPGKFARIRVQFAATVNAICYMKLRL
jgi:hypothetical protein